HRHVPVLHNGADKSIRRVELRPAVHMHILGNLPHRPTESLVGECDGSRIGTLAWSAHKHRDCVMLSHGCLLTFRLGCLLVNAGRQNAHRPAWTHYERMSVNFALCCRCNSSARDMAKRIA